MKELRADDLRFTFEEVTAFLNDVTGLGLSTEDINTLDAQTEGWIAGLQLAALALQEKLSVQGREGAVSFINAFGASHRFVLEYLVEEVLEQQSPAIQLFLLKTSILERMTASLCNAVYFDQHESAEEDFGREILSELDRANLFLISLDDERRWYRYHHLFAEILRGRLSQTIPDELSVLHHRASVWYEHQGLTDEAVAHAIDAQDLERAADLIEQYGMQMIAGSEVSRLSRWLEQLPEEFVRTRPWLCVFLAWVRYYVGPRDQVALHLQDAKSALDAALEVQDSSDQNKSGQIFNNRMHIAGHIAALRAYLALQNEDFDLVAELAQVALDLLPEEDYARGTSAIALAETPRKYGDLVASERAYDRAREIAEECGNLPMAVSAVAYMGLQQAKQGRLHLAYETYLEALDLATTPDGHELPAAGLPYVNLGDLMREWNELEVAGSYLEKASIYATSGDMRIRWSLAISPLHEFGCRWAN